MKSLQYVHKSKIGMLYFVASEKGLQGIFWKKKLGMKLVKDLRAEDSATRHLVKAIIQVDEYLEGKRKKFDLDFDIQGTAFQKCVWRELAKIPYGETVSYTDIARRISNGKAVRAVGTANGRNPLSLIVPCHRVIAASGGLGGYAGGLRTKEKLLALEKKTSSKV